MERLRLVRESEMTLEDGCNKYLDNCRARNLRAGIIRYYSVSYKQFYKYFGKDMLIKNFNVSVYKKYVAHLRETLNNDVSINAYLRDLITTLHFFMNEEYIPYFKMQAIKVDKTHVETYTDEELLVLLKKPNVKSCTFAEYQSWVMTNFLFSTGVRQRSLINIQIKDKC